MKTSAALSALICTAVACQQLSVQATLRQWSGGAQMNNDWTTPANWQGNIPPIPGDDLFFSSGASHPNNNNNYTNGTTFNLIEIRGAGGSGYTLSGSSIAINAGLQINNNTGTPIDHTVNNSFLLNSNQTFLVNNPVGILFLSGAVDLNGKDLIFDVIDTSEARAQGVISGTGALIKTNAGTLLLTANNTYSAPTTLAGGTLHVNGSQPASALTLSTGTIKGTGTLGILTATGTGATNAIIIAPGSSAGILTSSNVALNSSSTLAIELNGTTPGSGYDQLNVNGSVSLNNASLSVTTGFTPAPGNSFTILNNDGSDPVGGTFSGLPQGATFAAGPNLFQINYTGGTGNDVVLTRIVTLEIEPVSSTGVRVLWVTNGTAGFSLESNTNLSTTNWVLATPPPVVVDTKNVVTNTFPPGEKYYRLHKP